MIPVWRAQGYVVRLLFFRLANPEKALERVAQRVREGGHNVPEDVIRRRLEKGWSNFQEIYLPIGDEWILYDSTETTPVVIERECNPRPPGDTKMTVEDPKSDLCNRGAEEDPQFRRTRVDSFEAGCDQGKAPRHRHAGLCRHLAQWQDVPRHQGIGVGKGNFGFDR